jgi:predicted CXXCH cytochrome family protein
MTQFAAADTVRADFRDATLTNGNTRFVLSKTNDEFWVHMERAGSSEPGQPEPPSVDGRIGLVTGSHHMQVFWLPSDQGNAQVGFPFTWLIPENRWVPRKATFVRPPELPHLAELWNISCSRCHTTAVEPRLDSVHHVAATRVGELGIACEACHGPGEHHVQARKAEPNKDAVEPEVLRHEIVHPRKLDPLRAAQICGFCHSMKWFDKSEGWREHGFRYRPGDDLEQTTPIIRYERAASVPEMAAYLQRNPEVLRDFFWPDGMIRVSGRDYNGLIESPCYKGGQFSCLSCHSLHKADPDAQLDRSKAGNRACTQCHEKFALGAQVTAHTHHLAGSSGSECYNCHMPHTTYGVLKAISSHQISSPKLADELKSGRPNACNLCHLDKTLAWTADYLDRWFRQARPQLTDSQNTVSDAVQFALAGDAGQRALLAWHLGWKPAVEASGKDWVQAILGQMLDDPYPAVRCIAERSMRRLALLPDGYDFAAELSERPPMRDAVLESWSRGLADDRNRNWPAATLVNPSDLAGTRRRLDDLSQQRDDRPVRLRE